MTTTPEGTIKNKVKKILLEQEVYFFCPVQMGYGAAGLDFHCVVLVKNYPLAFFIETKKPGGKTTPRQHNLIEILTEKYKSKVWVIDSSTDIASLELWLQTIRGT